MQNIKIKIPEQILPSKSITRCSDCPDYEVDYYTDPWDDECNNAQAPNNNLIPAQIARGTGFPHWCPRLGSAAADHD